MRAKEKILIAAERLFAERGFGVPMREIAVEAGQRNHAAVQYHFKDKAGLVEALYAYRMTPLNDRRRALLTELRETGRDQDLPSLVEAFISPLADHVLTHRGTSWYLRFTSRYVLSGGYQDWPFSPERYPAVTELTELLNRRLPALTAERLHILSLHIVIVLADLEQRLTDPDFLTAPATLTELRTTALALLSAPPAN